MRSSAVFGVDAIGRGSFLLFQRLSSGSRRGFRARRANQTHSKSQNCGCQNQATNVFMRDSAVRWVLYSQSATRQKERMRGNQNCRDRRTLLGRAIFQNGGSAASSTYRSITSDRTRSERPAMRRARPARDRDAADCRHSRVHFAPENRGEIHLHTSLWESLSEELRRAFALRDSHG